MIEDQSTEDPFRDPFAPSPSKRRVPLEGRPPGVSKEGKYKGKIPGEAGIWAFLFFDLWWFTALFGVTIYERGQDVDVFHAGRESLNLWEGTLNTLLLLTGSMFVVLAIQSVRALDQEKARKWILYAMGTGLLFLVNKGVEYTHLLSDDHDPGQNDFYQYFFILTGIHALHLIGGLAALAYMRKICGRPQIDQKGHRNLEVVATYWHLVDLLWVVIFAVFYLVR